MFTDKYRLLAPGPVQIPKEVLDELSKPMVHHRTPLFTKLFEKTLDDLKFVFRTKQPVMVLPTTGTGAMEASLVNTLSPGDEALFIASGKFGERWATIANQYDITAHILEVDWGTTFDISTINTILDNNPNIKAIFTQSCETSTCVLHDIHSLAKITKDNPGLILVVDAISSLLAAELPMDEWGVDVVITGSQKSLMLPTGLSFVCLSEKAWEFNKASECPKFYLDLEKELEANKKNMTHFSSSVSLIRALNVSLSLIKDKGLEHYQKRCEKLQELTLLSLKIFNIEDFASSPIATALEVPEGIDGLKLRSHIEENYNVTFMGGQDHLKGKIIRIGHIGDISDEDFLAAMYFLGKSLIDLNYKNLDAAKVDALIEQLKEKL